MSTMEKRFRRNFVVACIVHVAIIGGIVVFEGVFSNAHSNVPATTELIIPADILGDLPTGAGTGRGNYAPPPPEPASENTGAPSAPSEPAAKPAEPVAPKATVPPPDAKDPNDILIPKKPVAKETKKPVDTTARKPDATDKTADKTVDKTATAKKAVANAKPSVKTGPATPAVSADTIRQRFASALAASEGGNAGGDNKAPGGGSGVSKYGRLGSPDGAADGIAGGVGKGSQFASYYMHVHDRMYEAWDQPGQAKSLDKKLVTTLILHVARDGRIEGVRLDRPSGNKLMDDSVMSAAHSVPRLDPLPEGLGGDFAEISVNFRLEG
jgi:outer membrane biosynthesis protein TonB